MKNQKMKKKPHPYREGYHLEFKNGHIYSVVNLASHCFNDLKSLNEDQRLFKLMTETYEFIGRTYDFMGGRFEAILLPESNNGEWGETIRGHSFEEVITKVKEHEHEGN